MTDEAALYSKLGDHFAKHGAVDHHRGEYGYTDRAGDKINTNTVEGFYSVFKRGMILSALRRAAPSPLSRRI
jgi:hypothetical protein